MSARSVYGAHARALLPLIGIIALLSILSNVIGGALAVSDLIRERSALIAPEGSLIQLGRSLVGVVQVVTLPLILGAVPSVSGNAVSYTELGIDLIAVVWVAWLWASRYPLGAARAEGQSRAAPVTGPVDALMSASIMAARASRYVPRPALLTRALCLGLVSLVAAVACGGATTPGPSPSPAASPGLDACGRPASRDWTTERGYGGGVVARRRARDRARRTPRRQRPRDRQRTRRERAHDDDVP